MLLFCQCGHNGMGGLLSKSNFVMWSDATAEIELFMMYIFWETYLESQFNCFVIAGCTSQILLFWALHIWSVFHTTQVFRWMVGTLRSVIVSKRFVTTTIASLNLHLGFHNFDGKSSPIDHLQNVILNFVNGYFSFIVPQLWTSFGNREYP